MKINLPNTSIIFNGKLMTPFFLVLVILGLAGNYFKYQIFFNVDFIFGSVFAILALQFFGMFWGIVAAVIISSVTFFLWLHPYAIIIMTCEVVFVAMAAGKNKMGFVMADSIYWLVAGIPLVFLFYHVVMNIPMSNTFIIMLKQSINGIFNAIIARLVFSLAAIFRGEAMITFRETVFNLLAFFVLTSSLVLLFIDSRIHFSNTDDEIRRSLSATSHRVTSALQKWLNLKTSSVTQLARLAETLPVGAMQERIEQSLASDPDFLRMGMTDVNATITAYSPLFDELGKKNIGKNFADRPYIPVLKSTLKPMLSEVVMGRIGVPKPFTSILVPVVKNGGYSGYVIGVINFDRIREFLAENVEGTGIHFNLLDKNRNIVVTSYPDRKAMTEFTRGPGETVLLDDKVIQWVPSVQKAATSIMERWRNSYYIASSQIGTLSEWELVLEQPIAPFQKSLNDEYSNKMIVAFSIFFIALFFAEFVSRKVLSSTDKLQEITTALPSRLKGGGETDWPRSSMAETHRLIGNFRDMEEALKQKFRELEEINEELENKVNRRTAQLNAEVEEHKKTARNLRESEAKYRVIFENDIYAICIIGLETMRFIDLNDAQVGMYGYTREEFLSGMTIYDISAEREDSEKTIQEVIRDGSIFIPLRYHRKKDGTIFPVEIVGGRFFWQGREVLFALVHDITERVEALLSLDRLAKEQSVILNTLTAGVVFIKDRTVVWANSAFNRLFGYDGIGTVGMNVSRFFPGKDDYLTAGKDFPALSEGGIVTEEIRMRKTDGSFFWASLVGCAVSSGNMDEGTIWTVEDITSRVISDETIKEQMAILSSLVENVMQGVLYEDFSRVVRFVNKTFCEIFGIPSPEAIRGADCAALARVSKAYFADPDGFVGGIEERLKDRRVVLAEELKMADGRILERDFIPVTLGDKSCGLYWIYRDITERKRAEENLKEKTRQLEDLTKNLENKVDREISRRMRNEQILIQQSKLATMGEMLGAIAHQWRQPLNALGLSIQNIRESFSHGDLDKPMIDNMVRMSMGHIKQMSKTIDDFRNFFSPDKGKTEFDAMVAVGEVLSLLSAQMSAYNVDYRLSCLHHGKVFDNVKNIIPCEEKVIEGYRNEFQHVIMNVTDNAMDSIRERFAREKDSIGRGLVSFDFDNREGWIVITIRDNGAGIPEAIFDRVFEPYFTTKEQSRGTGIGLYMAKIIIEDHMAGRISALKNVEGAAFVIELPAAVSRCA